MEINKYSLMLVKEKGFKYEGKIVTEGDAAEIARIIGYENYAEEHLGMFCLNNKGNIVGYHEISHGSLAHSDASPREIFKRAIVANAACILLVHNHTSGDSTPSDVDLETTKRLKEAGELLQIPVIDHIIIGHDGDYTSLHSLNYV